MKLSFPFVSLFRCIYPLQQNIKSISIMKFLVITNETMSILALNLDTEYFYRKPTRCSFFRVYWISFCMFRKVFPAIISSSRLYIEYHVYVIQDILLHSSGHEMELGFPYCFLALWIFAIYFDIYIFGRQLFFSADFLMPYCCVGFVQFFFDVSILVYFFAFFPWGSDGAEKFL